MVIELAEEMAKATFSSLLVQATFQQAFQALALAVFLQFSCPQQALAQESVLPEVLLEVLPLAFLLGQVATRLLQSNHFVR